MDSVNNLKSLLSHLEEEQAILVAGKDNSKLPQFATYFLDMRLP